MAKQYIPGVSGLLTEPNPVDAPSNTLSDAENVIIDQSGKAQARHGLNINQDEATTQFAANSNEALSTNTTFITPIGDTTPVSDSLTNYVHYSSFLNDSDATFKIIEFKNSNNTVLSGLFVKQGTQQYSTTSTGQFVDYLYKNSSTDSQYRYYQIAADSGKLIQQNKLPFVSVSDVFSTNLSVYMQTEQGITETNVDDLFRPADNRFFPIRWPSFPKLSYTIIQSAIYANWLPANHKVGIRITFYREMGYGDKEERVYESQPSPVYEIVNNGKEGIPNINLDLLSSINTGKIYKQWNDFCKLNNGRKFGIKIYRTFAVPSGQSLGTDFFECYEPISFDTLLTSKIVSSNDTQDWHRFDSPFTNSLLKLELVNELFNVNDTLSYIFNNVDENGGSIASGYVYNATKIKNFTTSLVQDDILPARLKIVDKRKYGTPSVLTHPSVNFFNQSTTLTNYLIIPPTLEVESIPGDGRDIAYRAFEYIPSDYNSRYIDAVEMMLTVPAFQRVDVNSTPCTFINGGSLTTDYVDIADSPFSNGAIIKFKLANVGDTLPSGLSTALQYKLQVVSVTGNVTRYQLYIGTNVFPEYWTTNGTGTAIAYESMFTSPDVNITWSQGTSVVVASTGTLPSPLVAGTTYYIAQSFGNYFKLSYVQSPSGLDYNTNEIINVTSNGSGVHRIRLGSFPTTGFEIWETITNTTGVIERKNKVAVASLTNSSVNSLFYTLTYKFNSTVSLKPDIKYILVFTIKNGDTPWLVPLQNNVVPDNVYRKVYGWVGYSPITALSPDGYTGLTLNHRMIRYVDQYEYQLQAVNNIRLSTNGSNTSGLVLRPGSVLDKDASPGLTENLVNNRYFIRYFNIELNLNDEALTDIGSPLYTNPNADGAFYTNVIAPKSQFIAPYKDFHVYTGPIKPLQARISVISQPAIEQHNCVPRLSDPFYTSRSITFTSGTATFTSATIGLTNGNSVYFSALPVGETNFKTYTPYYVVNAAAYPGGTFQLSATVGGSALSPNSSGTATMQYQRWPSATQYAVQKNGFFTTSSTNLSTNTSNNGLLFFESALTGPRRYQIDSFPSGTPSGFLPAVNQKLISFGGSYGLPDISTFYIGNSANLVLNIDHEYLTQNVSFNSTMYESPYLTLRLVSLLNITNDIVIQTEPLYNRRGYYALKNEYDEYDDGALTYDLSFDEMNAFRKSSTNLILRRGLDNIYHVVGERSGQVSSDGVFAGFDTVSVTTVTSNADITLARHNFTFNDTVQFVGTAPGGFTVGTTYYAQSTGANTFRLYTSPNSVGLVTPSSAGTFSVRLTTSGKFLAKWINDSTSNIYFDKDTNTIVIKNMGNIDIKKFEAPGILMIQSNATDIILFTYSSIDTSQSTANTYTFKSVALQYIGRNKYPNEASIYDPAKLNEFITQTTNYFSIAGPTYLFFLKGTSVDGLPLYPYAKELYLNPDIDSISIGIDSIKTTIVERYTPTDITATNPTFTLIPHNKMSNIPVGDFKRSKNYSFYGINRKDAGEYIDLYAWQIIIKFNIELQRLGIKAYLSKGEGIGEILITYPDGISIQMMNGKYDTALAANVYPGKHTFLPELNKLEFVELAKKDEQDVIENNQIAISRREIPEITPAGSFATVGSANKKFIGYAENSDDLYIFKEDGIFRITDAGNITSNVPNLQVFQFSTNLICQAAGSIKEINDEIIFLSQYGFMSISGGGVQNISGAIQRDILTLIQTSPKDRIRSFVNESKQLYYCTLINEVDATLKVKSGTYIFNTKTRQWSFMDHEIIDGLEDSEKRNLVAYKQKAIVGTSNTTSSWTTSDGKIHRLVGCDISYPMQTTEFINNFYFISRERHTNNIVANAKDQYDYISENLIVTNSIFSLIANGFTITIPVSQNAFRFHYAQKLFKIFTPPTTINISGNQYAIVDSPIQMLSNREIFVEMLRTGSAVPEYYATKLTKFEYLGSIGTYAIKYTFEYLTTSVPTTPITLQSLRVLGGVPVKITFNPESGSSPDSNKLFQEYMIHTETANKGAIVSFKTDSRSNFTTDRRFVYDPNATNRNVFRTYIPTQAARGRYLIRQIKHDVPLENLIITGQTIVMRDTSSTRVQKDKD